VSLEKYDIAGDCIDRTALYKTDTESEMRAWMV
jgi:hypothetical protein